MVRKQKETVKRATPRKRTPRPIPEVIRILAYCANAKYREDWKRLNARPTEAKRKAFFEKYYPTYGVTPINPTALSPAWWERLAKRGGRFDGAEGNRDYYFLARMAGGVEDPDAPGEIIQGASDPVTVIPAGWDFEKPKGLPVEGYDPTSLKNLLGNRFLYLKLDVMANDDTLASRVKTIVHDYKRQLNLDGRNREAKMKYIAYYRVEQIADEKKKDARSLITTDRKKWRGVEKDLSRARKEVTRLFRALKLPT